MIELFVLIFLTRNIGKLAARKGQRPGRWKLYTVLAWFAFEFPGALIGLFISQNIFLALLLGLGCAFGGYLVMKYQLDKMPDLDKEWPGRIGNTNGY
jgi:hypothetical protein